MFFFVFCMKHDDNCFSHNLNTHPMSANHSEESASQGETFFNDIADLHVTGHAESSCGLRIFMRPVDAQMSQGEGAAVGLNHSKINLKLTGRMF